MRRRRIILLLAILAWLPATAASPQPAPRDFRRWLSQDVEWLLTLTERSEAQQLTDKDAQERFVREFWRRRDPTPGTNRNEWYEEHTRRLAEADAKFSSGKRGRFTDRGRVYITWGPPDFVETNPNGGRGFALGALSTAPELPTEAWTYEHLAGVQGRSGRVQVLFVDRGGGDYRLLTDPSDANLAYVYRLNTPANPLQYESAAYLDPATGLRRTDRVAETDRAETLGPDTSLSSTANAFERIALGADLNRTAGDVLDDIARSERLRRPWGDVRARMFARRFAIDVDVPVFRARQGEAYCPVAVAIPGEAIVFAHDSRYRAELDVQATVRDARSGTPVRRFADTVRFQLDEAMWERGRRAGFTYHKAMMLQPGEYVLDLSIAQPAASALGSASVRITVPARSETITIATLVLGEAAPAGGAVGPFTVGDVDLRPRVTRRFEAGERIHALAQVAGLDSGAAADLTADYVIMRDTAPMYRSPLYRLPAAERGVQDRLVMLPIEAGPLPPGAYIVQLKVIEHVSQKYAVARVPFTIAPVETSSRR